MAGTDEQEKQRKKPWERPAVRELVARAAEPPSAARNVPRHASPQKPTAEALGFVDRADVPVDRMRRSIHRSHRGEGKNFVD